MEAAPTSNSGKTKNYPSLGAPLQLTLLKWHILRQLAINNRSRQSAGTQESALKKVSTVNLSHFVEIL